MRHTGHKFIFSIPVILIIFFSGCGGGGGGGGGTNGGGATVQNNSPTWDSIPGDVTAGMDQSYGSTIGIASDVDNGTLGYLSCGLSNNTCSFDISIAGQGQNHATCQISFISGSSPEACTVNVVVRDGGNTSLTETINISVAAPSISINCFNPGPNPVVEGNQVVCSITTTGGGAQIDSIPDTCNGTLSGGNYIYTPNEAAGPGSCVAAVRNSNDISVKDQDTITIQESNQSPTWTQSPGGFIICGSGSVSQTNGAASDSDLPKASAGEPGYLTCGLKTKSCSFPVNVTGSGAGSVSCNVSFTVAGPENCSVEISVSDGYSASISQTFDVTVADRLYVNDDAAGAGSGLSWTNAITAVQEAANRASAGCEVWVAEGSYPTAGGGAPVLTMKDGVNFYGGFAGTESGLAERTNPGAHPSVLNGFNNSNNVVIGASNSRIDGFTITGGNQQSFPSGGGGMYNSGVSQLVVENCLFISNTASDEGGAIINRDYSYPVIANCTFQSNSAGGGVFGGGAICNLHSDSTISNCIFIQNTATGLAGHGGAIHNWDSTPVISNCYFNLNSCTNYYAGAIYNDTNTSPIITDCIFVANSAAEYGGAIYNNWTPAIIKNCIFDSNYAVAYNGGGILNYYSNLASINNCLFINNSARYGGGISNNGGDATITNSTFSGNNASQRGGAVSNQFSASIFNNCIFWGDTAAVSNPEIYNAAGGSPTISYSDIAGGYTGTGNFNSDPLFVTGVSGSYYLSQTLAGQGSNSPCLNAGSNTAASFGLDTRTTRTDNILDSGTVDIGYHYPVP